MLNTNLAPIGTKYEIGVPDGTNIVNATDITIASINVPAGTYVISATVFYQTPNGAGFRQISLSTGGHTRLVPNIQDWMLLNVSDIYQGGATTVRLMAYQTSGTTLTVSGALRIVRIK